MEFTITTFDLAKNYSSSDYFESRKDDLLFASSILNESESVMPMICLVDGHTARNDRNVERIQATVW